MQMDAADFQKLLLVPGDVLEDYPQRPIDTALHVDPLQLAYDVLALRDDMRQFKHDMTQKIARLTQEFVALKGASK